MTTKQDRASGIFMIKNCALNKVFIGCSMQLRDAKSYYFTFLRRGIDCQVKLIHFFI